MSERIVPDVLTVLLSFDDPAADVDVTDFVVQGGDRRGRSRELDDFNAGTCTITLENDSRDFDPPFANSEDFLTTDADDLLLTDTDVPLTTGESISTSGGTYGTIRAGQRVQVQFDGESVFDGWVDDWDHDWESSRIPTATLKASDALGRLGRRKFNEWTTTASQRVGARLTAALARPEVDWSGSTDFDVGAMNLQGDVVAQDTNALNYAQLLARTDGGRFFASRTNELTFRGVNLTTVPGVSVAFRDDDTGIDFYGIEVRYGSELWYTEVSVERVGGIRQTKTSSSLIRDLHGGGTIPLPRTGLLMTTNAAADNLAVYLLALLEQQQAVISALRVNMMTISDADAIAVAQLEMGSVITVNWTPTAAGDAVIQSLIVEGIHDDFDRSNWTRRLQVSNAVGIQTFVLDDPVLGILDVSPLGL